MTNCPSRMRPLAVEIGQRTHQGVGVTLRRIHDAAVQEHQRAAPASPGHRHQRPRDHHLDPGLGANTDSS